MLHYTAVARQAAGVEKELDGMQAEVDKLFSESEVQELIRLVKRLAA
jgi:hypothetical protein